VKECFGVLHKFAWKHNIFRPLSHIATRNSHKNKQSISHTMPKIPSKRTRSSVDLLDPIVETVRTMMEGNTQYFLDHIGTLVDKFMKHRDATQAIIEAQPRLTNATRVADPAAKNEAVSAFSEEEPKVPLVGAKVVISATDDESVVEVEFPDNEALKKQLKLLKREAFDLSTVLDGIVDWISLNAPAIEKGQEDAGAEIQDAVSEQVSNLTEAVSGVYEMEMKYLNERAELETTLLAMPEVKSIALAMEIHDSDMWDQVERAWKTMMRVCLIAYSVLSKNMGRLKNPDAASSSTAMYQ
jgi:hypothetical protein